MAIDTILKKYKKLKGESFTKRIAAFEKFHDPDNIEGAQLHQHAEYIVMGNPSDRKSFPGAYEKAHQALYKAADNDEDKIDNLDTLTGILETYVDEFLAKVMGDKFAELVAHAKAEGLDAKALRKAKGNLFARYTSSEGKSLGNILDESSIKKLKGKKRIELRSFLQGLAANTLKKYSGYLDEDIWGGYFKDEDHVDLAKYIISKFTETGL